MRRQWRIVWRNDCLAVSVCRQLHSYISSKTMNIPDEYSTASQGPTKHIHAQQSIFRLFRLHSLIRTIERVEMSRLYNENPFIGVRISCIVATTTRQLRQMIEMS